MSSIFGGIAPADLDTDVSVFLHARRPNIAADATRALRSLSIGTLSAVCAVPRAQFEVGAVMTMHRMNVHCRPR